MTYENSPLLCNRADRYRPAAVADHDVDADNYAHDRNDDRGTSHQSGPAAASVNKLVLLVLWQASAPLFAKICRALLICGSAPGNTGELWRGEK